MWWSSLASGSWWPSWRDIVSAVWASTYSWLLSACSGVFSCRVSGTCLTARSKSTSPSMSSTQYKLSLQTKNHICVFWTCSNSLWTGTCRFKVSPNNLMWECDPSLESMQSYPVFTQNFNLNSLYIWEYWTCKNITYLRETKTFFKLKRTYMVAEGLSNIDRIVGGRNNVLMMITWLLWWCIV